MDRIKLIKICETIASDAENDAKQFYGKIFNGGTVAEYFRNHGESIAALAYIIKEMLDKIEELENDVKGLYGIS